MRAGAATTVLSLDPADYHDVVCRALEEDMGGGDVTTNAIVPKSARARGVFLVKADCVVAGLDVAVDAFRHLDPAIRVTLFKRDGDRCRGGEEIAEITGSAAALLTAERVALNFLQRLCGIATRTREFVDRAGGLIVLDTRKTTPMLRALEKYAVRAGGGTNHRAGLFDAVLIKDNHIRIAGGVRAAIDKMRLAEPARPIEIEAQTLAEVDEALGCGVDIVLVDNLGTEDVRESVRRAHGRAKIEVSGGITLDRMRELAATGADFVSVGALTHSAPAIDISFEIEPI